MRLCIQDRHKDGNHETHVNSFVGQQQLNRGLELLELIQQKEHFDSDPRPNIRPKYSNCLINVRTLLNTRVKARPKRELYKLVMRILDRKT